MERAAHPGKSFRFVRACARARSSGEAEGSGLGAAASSWEWEYTYHTIPTPPARPTPHPPRGGWGVGGGVGGVGWGQDTSPNALVEPRPLPPAHPKHKRQVSKLQHRFGCYYCRWSYLAWSCVKLPFDLLFILYSESLMDLHRGPSHCGTLITPPPFINPRSRLYIYIHSFFSLGGRVWGAGATQESCLNFSINRTPPKIP